VEELRCSVCASVIWGKDCAERSVKDEGGAHCGVCVVQYERRNHWNVCGRIDPTLSFFAVTFIGCASERGFHVAHFRGRIKKKILLFR